MASEQLYESRRKVYPKAVFGLFRNLKWAVMAITLSIYYLTPWIRWDRGPTLPNQAVLVDLEHGRFYFFFIKLWPQEVYYFTGLLILGALVVFLLNALFGRVWCGYTCPQTVWTDLFLWVERWVEGDRNKRKRQDEHRWRTTVLSKKLIKYTLFLLISLATGGAWVFYFTDAPTLAIELLHNQASFSAYTWIGIFTGTTFLLGGFAREQVCIYMCPWPRIQAAMTDDDALNVTYRYDRGEPRASLKKRPDHSHDPAPNSSTHPATPIDFSGAKASLSPQPMVYEKAGDCIDCRACVAACPMGIDIREGLQLACIHCALCIDACDEMMDKVNFPRGLIAYDTDKNLIARQQGKPTSVKLFRVRTFLYLGLIFAISLLMGISYFSRDALLLTVQRDRNPLYVTLSNGDIRNGYTLKLSNRTGEARSYRITIMGERDNPLPMESLRMEAVGYEVDNLSITVPVNAEKLKMIHLFIGQSADQALPSRDIIFVAEPIDGSADAVQHSDYLKGPN